MAIKIEIPVYAVDEKTIITEEEASKNLINEYDGLILLVIDRDSYIVSSKIHIDMKQERLYNFQIGKYSAVANDTDFIIDRNHDYLRPCQGRIKGAILEGSGYSKRKGEIIIMNDCWIGQGCTILSGVIIGNGAVVAAGSVVTKNVPPYAVVGGNPARIIRYRFDEDIIHRLLKIRWWNWSKEQVLERAIDLYGDIEEFVRKYSVENDNNSDDSKSAPVIGVIPKEHEGEERRLIMEPDWDEEYPVFPRIIVDFAKKYSNTNYELLIVVRENENTELYLNTLYALFEQYKEYNCYINLYIGNEDISELMQLCDAYITTKNPDQVYNIDMAMAYGLEIISGVSIPVFD